MRKLIKKILKESDEWDWAKEVDVPEVGQRFIYNLTTGDTSLYNIEEIDGDLRLFARREEVMLDDSHWILLRDFMKGLGDGYIEYVD